MALHSAGVPEAHRAPVLPAAHLVREVISVYWAYARPTFRFPAGLHLLSLLMCLTVQGQPGKAAVSPVLQPEVWAHDEELVSDSMRG